ncbi:MAG: hypothetical protein ABI867_05290 [Kofleriaceae bacterium]
MAETTTTDLEKQRLAELQTSTVVANPPPSGIEMSAPPTTAPPQPSWLVGSENYDVTMKSDGGKVIGGGFGGGNREGDLKTVDPNDPTKTVAAKNSQMTLGQATSVPKPDLDKIPVVSQNEVKGKYGTHAGTEVRSGSATDASGKFDVGLGSYGGDGSPIKVEGPKASAQAGASAKANAGIEGSAQGDYGSVSGKADAEAKAYIGASAKAGIDENGASASAAAGLGAEAKVTANAEYKTPGLQVGDATIDAGVGVNGEASVSAAAGAGVAVSITKDEIGANFKAGAAIKAEAKADAHGNLGPVAGKFEGGVLAGAGAGVEGGIVYKDGKLTMGAKAYAALGYGATTGGEVTIDLAQAKDVGVAVVNKAKDAGIEGAKQLYDAADVDDDGRLTLNDPAQAASDKMRDEAEKLDNNVDVAIDVLDGDHDGKFTTNDVKARANELRDKAVDELDSNGDGEVGLDDAYDAGNKLGRKVDEKVTEGVDAAKQKVHEVGDKADKYVDEKVDQLEKVADRNGDGSVDLSDADQAAAETWQATKDQASKDWKTLEDGYDKSKDWASDRVDDAGDAIDGLEADAKKAADRNGDGELGIDDVAEGARETEQWAHDKAVETVEDAKQGLEDAEDAIEAKAKQAKDDAIDTYHKAHDAADVNGDGEIDSEDARLAAEQAVNKATALERDAKQKLADGADKALEKAEELKDQAEEKVEEAKEALDRDGDGELELDDAAQGAQELEEAAEEKLDEAGEAIMEKKEELEEKAAELKDEVVEQAGKAKDTFVNGASDAGRSVKNSGKRLKSFLFD